MSQMNRRPAPAGRAARPAAAQRPAAGPRPVPGGQPGAGRQGAPRPGAAQRPGPGGAGAPRQPAPRRGGSAAVGGRSPWVDVALIALGGVIVAVLALLLQLRWPTGFPLLDPAVKPSSSAVRTISEIHSDGPLRINEIMTGNRRVLAAEDGTTPDWVEVANVGNSALDLGGYSLAKTESGSGVFTFPSMTLEPGECALVLADSRLREDAGEALHAPFRLSSAGDTLMLFNASGTAIDTVNIPALDADTSYARTGASKWEQSARPTPQLSNDEDSYRLLTQPSGDSPVIINEIVASNDSALAAEDGLYYDYIELYNRSSSAVDLAGWCLSDDAAEARKWRFPEVSIDPGEYMVVFASTLNRKEDTAHLHTNFSLSSEGEAVALSDDSGRMMDLVEFGLLKGDTAWALGADGSWSSASPSPGSANGASAAPQNEEAAPTEESEEAVDASAEEQ